MEVHPYRHIRHADAVAGDMRLAAQRIGINLNMPNLNSFHA
jgi:hypothetical protein